MKRASSASKDNKHYLEYLEGKTGDTASKYSRASTNTIMTTVLKTHSSNFPIAPMVLDYRSFSFIAVR